MVKKIIRYFAMKDSYSFITYGMSILQIDANKLVHKSNNNSLLVFF